MATDSPKYTMKLGEHEIVFIKPGRLEWKAYKKAILNSAFQAKGSKSPVDLQEELVRKCVVSPDQSTLDDIAEQYGEVFEMIGAEIEELQSAGQLKRATKSG